MIEKIYNFKFSILNLILFVFIVVSIGLGASFQTISQILEDSSLRHQKRVVNGTENFNYLWQKDGISQVPIKKDVIGSLTYIQLYKSNDNDEVAIVLDSHLKVIDLSAGIEIVSTEVVGQLLAINSTAAFIFDPNQNTMTISAYSLKTGDKIWTNKIPKLAFVDWTYANNQVVSFSGNGQKALSQTQVSLDVQTGKIVAFQDFLSAYLNLHNSWWLESSIPKARHEEIIVGTMVDNIVFALNHTNSSLYALDPASGQTVGMITFDQLPLTYGRGHADFDIQYFNGYLVVYFGDSRQIFAFEFIPDSR